MSANLPKEIMPALQGVIPSNITTCSLSGEPNSTEISQVHYVDDHHVALSFQFFSKTIRNVRENPFAAALVVNPETAEQWLLELRYDHSESEGPVFEEMDTKLEVIASLTGMSGTFKLRSADLYEVLSVERLDDRIGR
jgi:hypothetical protein